MAGPLQLLTYLLQKFQRARAAGLIQQRTDQLAVGFFESLQTGFRCGGIPVPRGFNGFKDQIGDTRHRRNHHNGAVLLRGLAYDLRALAEARGIPYRGAAKLHDNQTFAHSILLKSAGAKAPDSSELFGTTEVVP